MASTETGWTGLFPQADGYYWMRLNPDDDVPTIVRHEARQLHEIGNADDLRWASFLKSAQFLPASPSDAEQLSELKRVITAVIARLEDNERWWLEAIESAGTEFRQQAFRARAQSTRSTINALRAALNPDLQKET